MAAANDSGDPTGAIISNSSSFMGCKVTNKREKKQENTYISLIFCYDFKLLSYLCNAINKYKYKNEKVFCMDDDRHPILRSHNCSHFMRQR